MTLNDQKYSENGKDMCVFVFCVCRVKVDNSREGVQDGREKVVISKALIGSPKQGGHVEEGKHKRKLGFALESLTMKAQELHNAIKKIAKAGNPYEFICDPRDDNNDQMIGMIEWLR
ncbi:hypothetical protein Tco_0679450 [Tanacetum coccineum]|uniref:Costars domain-containing protein n=1 Tax=Tanacetum coccineum TaxID=301880 RepID=A0ABQ4XHZ6_9ASTR